MSNCRGLIREWQRLTRIPFPPFRTSFTLFACSCQQGYVAVAAKVRKREDGRGNPRKNLSTDSPIKSRIASSKTMIPLLDGIKKQGDDPVELAHDARRMDIRLHTSALSVQADVSTDASTRSPGADIVTSPRISDRLQKTLERSRDLTPTC